jgi:hypothetical protein
VLEAGAAVIRPDRHVAEIGHGADELADGGAVVFDGDGVILGEGVARQARAERMVDAGAAERGVFLKKPLGHRAWLKHAHARAQAVAAADLGEFFQVVEIGLKIHLGPEPAGERGGEEVVETGRVGVELRVVFVGDEVLVGHVGLEPVDFAVREPAFGEGGGIMLGIKAAGRAPVLRIAAVPMRPVPAEGGGQKKPGLKFGAGGFGEAVRQQTNRGEKERGLVGRDFAGAVGDAEPHPAGLFGGGSGELFRPTPGSEGDGDAGAGGPWDDGDLGTGQEGEFMRGGVLNGDGGAGEVEATNAE